MIKLRRFLTIIIQAYLLSWALQGGALAAPLETSFFTWNVPESWTVSRNTSGLWQLTAPGLDPLEVLVSVGRLNTTPELYLASTATLWRSLGQVEPLQPWLKDLPQQAWFLVKHPPQPGMPLLSTVKWVRWRGPLLVVTSFKAPRASLESWGPKIRSMATSLKLLKPQYQEPLLREEVATVLRDNEDSRDGLASLDAARSAMNIARQDWEPFFDADKPPLYRAYADYLEARYDAAFAIVNGPSLGMGPDVVESRLQAVANRRQELRREFQGF